MDRSTFLHYYHCALYAVPFSLPVSEIASHIAPQESSSAVQQLAESGCRIVPHQLHVYKEPLDTKFGYVSFFVHQAPNSSSDADRVHRLACEWIRVDLSAHLNAVQCKVQLAQPPQCHSSEPFLDALRRLCPLLDPALSIDNRKLEAFLLGRVKFEERRDSDPFAGPNARQRDAVDHRGTSAAVQEQEGASAYPSDDGTAKSSGAPSEEGDDGWERCRSGPALEAYHWEQVGSFIVTSLTPKELVWLKRQMPSVPELQDIRDDGMMAASAVRKLTHFFKSGLLPLFTVYEAADKKEAAAVVM